jgi:hypothetical protein
MLRRRITMANGHDAPATDNGTLAPAADGGTGPGPAHQQTDVPTVRAIKDYPFEPGALTGLSPLPGYAGCIALVPRGADQLEVALFVSTTTRGGVAWLPPRGTVIMDVPVGFAVNDGAAILSWLQRSQGAGKPGSPGSVKGNP